MDIERVRYIIDKLLLQGYGFEIDMSHLAYAIYDHFPECSDEVNREHSLSLVRYFLENDLAYLGQFTSESMNLVIPWQRSVVMRDVVPWQGSIDEQIDQLRRNWGKVFDDQSNEIAHLFLTVKGEETAEPLYEKLVQESRNASKALATAKAKDSHANTSSEVKRPSIAKTLLFVAQTAGFAWAIYVLSLFILDFRK